MLFTGEEQGLLGSRAYVEQHRTELPNFVCALVMNWGAGHDHTIPARWTSGDGETIRRFVSRSGRIQIHQHLSGLLDVYGWICLHTAGLPGRSLLQDSPNYDRDADSTEDSMGSVNVSALQFNTRALGLSGVWLANVTERPGNMLTRAENEQALRPVQNVMQMVGVWPYL